MKTAASPVIASLDSKLARRWPATLTLSEVEALLIKAIYARKVAACAYALLELPEECLGSEACALPQAAQDACRLIDEEVDAEQDRIIARLHAAGIEVLPKRSRSFGKQFHSFELRVAPDDLEAALTAADADGFRRWAPTDDVTTRCILRWSDAKRPGRLRKMLQPSIVD